MRCPRCSFEQPDAPACARCGVVFAKLRAKAPEPTAWPTVAPPRATPAGGLPHVDDERPRAALIAGAAVLALALGGAFLAVRSRGAAAPTADATPRPRWSPAATSAAPVDLPSLAPVEAPTAPVQASTSTGLPDEDRERAESLAHRVNARQPISDEDLAAGESLVSRYESEPSLRKLLGAALLARASQEQGRRRHAESLAYLDRALQLDPGDVFALRGRVQACIELGDWRGAEAAARTLLGREPGDTDAVFGLGFALLRQDRAREAAEVLAPAESADQRIAALLERVRKGLRDEGGMLEQNLSRFHVRYDGEAHDEVGREILRALERHYATLARTFDHQPEAAITVILFSRASYNNASGAPAWSGGAYDGLDGKIRIPIGGLTRSLTPDMDETVVHELAHAFIWDMSRGQAPREVHEGLAQYLEGRRAEQELPERYLQALADGRLQGVQGYYAAALSFVEYLMALRGQGAMNELLKSMGSGASVDEAFERAYGRNMDGMKREWANRLRQQHGS